ncbi:hypothetical protein PM082_007670 [Marasmius tenuissimus]|nr:hypothetical protein PM082_007670 [Marasmius tenuissimus]
MRSKLLSPYLALTLLDSRMSLLSIYLNHLLGFLEYSTFIQAFWYYLYLTSSRNAVSPILQIFEIPDVKIFWRPVSIASNHTRQQRPSLVGVTKNTRILISDS